LLKPPIILSIQRVVLDKNLMANKIVHIAAAMQAKPGLEVYRDFSIESDPTAYPRPSRDDELKHLAGMIAEHNDRCTYSDDKIVYAQLTDADR